MRPLLFALLCLGLSLPAGAAGLAPFKAIYAVSQGGSTIGEDKVTLQRTGPGQYRYESSSRATGLLSHFIDDRIVESSRWQLQPDGAIRPLEYHYRRSGGSHTREVALRFDWARQRVINTINRDPWVMGIAPGTLDKLAVQLALMRDLGRGRKTMTYPIADGGTLKTYRFRVTGRASLETELGTLDTVRVQRIRRPGKRYDVLWCAPHLGYLPVQVVQYHNDEEQLRMTLRSLDPATGPAPGAQP